MSRIHLIAGARPNFMKVAPLYHALAKTPGFTPILVHTGQHYDAAMSDAFFADLALPAPDHHLRVGSASHAEQMARVMSGYDALCDRDPPDLAVVVGDVNSTLACAVVAAKRWHPVAHLEAGLRSGDRRMPEEINRVLTDHACDLLWAPSDDAVANLRAEGIPEHRIALVGNIMIDSLVALWPRIAAEGTAAGLGLSRYVVATFHRPANVDDPDCLRTIMAQLRGVSRDHPVVLPLHPRTAARLAAAGLLEHLRADADVHVIDPLGYIAFLNLVSGAAAVITDSGGIQEETSYLGIPCLTVRPNTERPVTVTCGTNRLIRPSGIAAATYEAAALDGRRPARIPFWDGATASRVVASLAAFLANDSESAADRALP